MLSTLILRSRAHHLRRLPASELQSCRHISWLRGLSSTPPEGGAKPTEPYAEGAGADADSEEVAALKAKLAETEEKLAQRLDQLKRAVADADNIRKRTAVDVENAHKYSIGSFAKNLLEVADNLERALALVPEEVRSGAENSKLKMLYEGVRLTDEQLIKSFQTVALKRINPIDEKFNPNLHEALFEMADPSKEPGTVGQVLSVGYTLHDRCLRPAKVGVVSKPK